jgi:hypothetical protein
VRASDTPRGWLGGRQLWNQHAYNIVNVNDNLTIPTVTEPNSPYHNNFRSGDVNPVYEDNAPNAVPLADACNYECDDGRILLEVRLGNQGTATLPHDMKLTIYVADTDAVLAIESISPPMLPWETSPVLNYEFAADAVGEDGLIIVVADADGVESIRECDEDSNVLALPGATYL